MSQLQRITPPPPACFSSLCVFEDVKYDLVSFWHLKMSRSCIFSCSAGLIEKLRAVRRICCDHICCGLSCFVVMVGLVKIHLRLRSGRVWLWSFLWLLKVDRSIFFAGTKQRCDNRTVSPLLTISTQFSLFSHHAGAKVQFQNVFIFNARYTETQHSQTSVTSANYKLGSTEL